ncbi:MAG TPA: GNAT family N-acetyltransferase [Gemmatimonadales bacterium]|nr:GNAT family N-acetyltransferase [Gemmatimonadales bacterium]
MQLPIEHDTRARKFVMRLPSGEAFLAYTPVGKGVLEFYSTYVPPPARGNQVASDLVRTAMDFARERRYRIIPSCWYVQGWVERHPEYQALIEGISD